jgi:hypothetical protein
MRQSAADLLEVVTSAARKREVKEIAKTKPQREREKANHEEAELDRMLQAGA